MNELILILKINGQCEVKYIMTLPIKTIVLKVWTYSITAHSFRLPVILTIMSVWFFITAIRDGPSNFQGVGGYGYFLKKYSDFGGGKQII
jgi:hypothetical protein